ncbi:hypothetical protein SAMN06272737_112149 [Blastococcus mobilis]|uniref:Uncharacterized protein n=1 Tax=Blastococcus mobilis TaxID=1938746 RepID=A0A238XEF0_9ACTN|nr:hypothetical protein SAMN06272737_112149 [Blastococcus mobilis]
MRVHATGRSGRRAASPTGGAPRSTVSRRTGQAGRTRPLTGSAPASLSSQPRLLGDEVVQVLVVRLPQLGVAPLSPAAVLAVADRRGSGRRRRGHEGLQPAPRTAGVRGDVDQPPRTRLAVPGGDVDELRRHPLQVGEPLGVRRHLQQRGDLQLPGELGIGDLVRPVSEDWRRRLDPQQEVGLPTPGAVEERPLVDNIDASPHRLDRLLRAPAALGIERRLDLGDRLTGGHQRGQVLLLVLQATVEDELKFVRRLDVRRRPLPAATPRSSRVRCQHSWWEVRSVGLSTSRPSSRCITYVPFVRRRRQPAGRVPTHPASLRDSGGQ